MTRPVGALDSNPGRLGPLLAARVLLSDRMGRHEPRGWVHRLAIIGVWARAKASRENAQMSSAEREMEYQKTPPTRIVVHK